MRIAVAPDVPARAVFREHRARDRKGTGEHSAFDRIPRRRETRTEPALILDPKRIHGLAGYGDRIAFYPEGHHVLAVVLDESHGRVLPIAFAEEEEKVAAV